MKHWLNDPEKGKQNSQKKGHLHCHLLKENPTFTGLGLKPDLHLSVK
jgi:hypothetical protein